jgi:non-specific serine/threonine protein kinase/serine/threonine-protein kinase
VTWESATATNAAEARHLAGDLDAIVLKALRKEPPERYVSAEQLADDVRRHLDGRPVMARRGTVRYRVSKFIRRNQMGVAAAALVAAAMLGGVAGIVWEARVALAARARAERRFNDVQKLAHFLLFDFHDAIQKLPGTTPIQRMLVERSLGYLDSLAQEAGGDPALGLDLAEAYVRLGDVQGNPYKPNLGDAAGALASYCKALPIAEAAARGRAGDPRATRALAGVHAHLGDLLLLSRQNKEAAAHARLAVETLEKLVAAYPNDVDARVDLASSQEGLGDHQARGAGTRAGALEDYRKSQGQWEAVLRLVPGHVREHRAVAGLNMKIADIEAAQDAHAALDRLRKALGYLAALPPAERTALASRRLEASIRQRVADCRWELKDTQGSGGIPKSWNPFAMRPIALTFTGSDNPWPARSRWRALGAVA